MTSPVVLVVLDGWGLSSDPGNIVHSTPLPTFDILNNNYPMIALQASGISVGLPWGDPGNSEVGHMTMGAGRIMYQSLPRISLAIQDGSFANNKALNDLVAHVTQNKSSLHIMGLVGDGAVHASRDHLYAILNFAKTHGLHNVYIHCFTDGRDSSPKAAGDHVIAQVQEELTKTGVGKIASIIGRNWAMDRNNNWDRIQKAYDMMVKGTGTLTKDPIGAIKASYDLGITDEFIEPLVITEDGETPLAQIKDGDGVVFYNFRDDRAREITKAFSLPGFEKFDRGAPLDINFTTMMEYEKDLPVNVAFPPESITNSLGQILSANDRPQLRIAETEKYAHVTYFFNCGAEDPFPLEDHILVPSPAVDKFDQRPEMSAYGVTDKIIEVLSAEKPYEFIMVNYANADMVAHTGNEEAAREAIKVLDVCMHRLIKAVLGVGGQMLITSDHGNVEVMHDPQSGAMDTKHNTSPIPLWYITPTNHRQKTPEDVAVQEKEIRGLLSDVAPTILEIMGIRKPSEMQGESLLEVLK
jgi:2,3-bisphosphoglycerate-independent phosphoglycerate mutase